MSMSAVSGRWPGPRLRAGAEPAPARLLDAVQRWFRVLAQVFHPGPLHAGIVRGRLDLVQEVDDVGVEPLLQLLVGDAALRGKGQMGLSEREHVRVHPRPE